MVPIGRSSTGTFSSTDSWQLRYSTISCSYKCGRINSLSTTRNPLSPSLEPIGATVKSLNKGHLQDKFFVPCREVGLSWRLFCYRIVWLLWGGWLLFRVPLLEVLLQFGCCGVLLLRGITPWWEYGYTLTTPLTSDFVSLRRWCLCGLF